MVVIVWIAMISDSTVAYKVGKHPQMPLYSKNPKQKNAFGKRHWIQYFVLLFTKY